MTSKPDWEDAPDWAQYLAKNSGGDWWWHEERPRVQSQIWRAKGGRSAPADDDWEFSLEERPWQ